MVTFRLLTQADAEQSRAYINAISAEDTFIGFSGEQLTEEEERSYIKSCVDSMANKDSLHVVAEFEDAIVSMCDARRDQELKHRSAHIAKLGLTVAKDFRGEGIGEALLKQVISLLPESIPNLRLLKLGVFAQNQPAIALYQKLGFQQYGQLPEGLLFHGEYIDHLLMYKTI